MTAFVVYLDQNKWIDLARASYGKIQDENIRQVLDWLRATTQQGNVVLPLSSVHYLELHKRKDPGSRARLGAFMWELSRGHTLRAWGDILKHELQAALARRRKAVEPRRLEAIGKGIGNAFGLPLGKYRIPNELREGFSQTSATLIEEAASTFLEKAALTGIGPDGITMPPFTTTYHNQVFLQHLNNFPKLLAELNAESEDAIYACALLDIREPVTEVLTENGLTWDFLTDLGKDSLKQFLDELPSRRVETHLHRQLIKNPSMRTKLNDLEDWAAMGPSVAYCDVVVCEKHMADLLSRDQFHVHARVTNRLQAIPDLYENAA